MKSIKRKRNAYNKIVRKLQSRHKVDQRDFIKTSLCCISCMSVCSVLVCTNNEIYLYKYRDPMVKLVHDSL